MSFIATRLRLDTISTGAIETHTKELYGTVFGEAFVIPPPSHTVRENLERQKDELGESDERDTNVQPHGAPYTCNRNTTFGECNTQLI